MRLGVLILPEEPWPEARRKWQRAEQLGFEHAWTYDHLAWRGLRDSPWFGALPTLAAAAAVTSTIRLGTLVASPEVRHPVPFAREVVTLDEIAGGRFTFAVAASARRSLRVAARHGDLWAWSGPRTYRGPQMGAAEGAAATARQIARLDVACAAEGRAGD